MKELKAQAESLGIDVDGRWSEKRIQAEIDKALEAPAPDAVTLQATAVVPAESPVVDLKPVTVTNLRDNPNKRLGLKGRGQIVLSADQLSNKQLMARIMHGVETGVLDFA